jgi:succinate dehydrogenase / fumarate reductase membrane anchor subunit
MSRRTPLGRVLGLGSAKEGTDHWWSQRVTAVALTLLGLWFAFSIATMAANRTLGFDGVTAWLGNPVNAVLTILLVATAALHSNLGLRVIVEDYVAADALKVAGLIALQFIHAALAAIGIYAVLRISFGGAA